MDLIRLSSRNLKQTVLLVTHDERIALRAERIVTIEDGRIVSDRKQG
jgi:putative ABC transport system ATP-binding protein